MASLLAGVLFLASCETDRDDNPVMGSPKEFVLNEIAFGETPVALASSQSIELVAANQPAYGFPTDVTYGAQMSLNQKWEDSASVYTIDLTTKSLRYEATATEIDRGIMLLGNYTDASQLDPNKMLTVYLRMTARPTNMGTEHTIYSNVQKLNVYPYFMSLKAAEPDYWFLVGGSIGDGKWTNSGDASAYLSLFPLGLIKDGTYDAKTGKGEFETTLYLSETGSIKLKHYADSWDFQWGWGDGKGVHNDGGSSDYKPADGPGFYTVHYNSAKEDLTITKAEKQEYPTFTTVGIIGTIGDSDWKNDIEMSPAAGAGANNHLWTAQVSVGAEGAVFKFRANNDWGTNWGFGANDGDVNLYGFTTNGGKNIGIAAGEYTIYFNDIDGFFRIVPVGDKHKAKDATE